MTDLIHNHILNLMPYKQKDKSIGSYWVERKNSISTLCNMHICTLKLIIYFLTPIPLRRNNIHTERSSPQLLANMARCCVLKLGVKAIYIWKKKQKIVLVSMYVSTTKTHTHTSKCTYTHLHTLTHNVH